MRLASGARQAVGEGLHGAWFQRLQGSTRITRLITTRHLKKVKTPQGKLAIVLFHSIAII